MQPTTEDDEIREIRTVEGRGLAFFAHGYSCDDGAWRDGMTVAPACLQLLDTRH
jgi:hypothetical protein